MSQSGRSHWQGLSRTRQKGGRWPAPRSTQTLRKACSVPTLSHISAFPLLPNAPHSGGGQGVLRLVPSPPRGQQHLMHHVTVAEPLRVRALVSPGDTGQKLVLGPILKA